MCSGKEIALYIYSSISRLEYRQGDINLSFKPSGLITLTTDFGHRGPFIGVMKGVIIDRCPKASVIDLTHECLVHWPTEAGFWIARSYSFFTVGTLHLAVVDPGVGTRRGLLIILLDGHIFLGPNNGLLAEIAAKPGSIVRLMSTHVIEKYRLPSDSRTFHGRDILAPIAAALVTGRLRFEECGVEFEDYVRDGVKKPEFFSGTLTGQVITTDNFGNLITNISREALGHFRNPRIVAGGEKIELKKTYGDVVPGKYLALINSLEMLEIACSERNAMETLGIGRGASVKIVEGAAKH